MRLFLFFITIMLPLGAYPALATGETTSVLSPVEQLKLETWDFNPGVVQVLTDRAADAVDLTPFNDSIMKGISRLNWNACGAILGEDPRGFGCDSSGHDFFQSLERYVLSLDFVTQATKDEDLIRSLVKIIGVGRANVLLTETASVYTSPFDESQGLAYVGWAERLCHIRFAEGDKHLRAGYPTLAECREDRFTYYLREQFCNTDPTDRCILNNGWLYGFLVRRYFDGGADVVAQWQLLLQRTAAEAGVALVVR